LSKYDEFKKIWDNVKQGTTETYNIEFKINNSTRKIKNTFVPITNKDNSIERIFCIATDITGQQNTEEELEKAKRQIKETNDEFKNLKQIIRQKEIEIDSINKELMDSKQQNADNRTKLDKATASAQFFKRELEKRISKFRKIESSLKEKVKGLEEKLGITKNNGETEQKN